MTITRKAAGAADFLPLVPRMIGYQPERSLVLVAFAGSRSVGVLRFDLPPADVLVPSAQSMAGFIARIEGATGFVPVVYIEGNALEGIGLPLIYALDEQAHMMGLHLNDKLIVASDGWVSAYDESLTVHPLSEIAPDMDDPELAALPAARSILDGTELPVVTDHARTEVASALENLHGAMASLTGFGDATVGVGTPEALLTIAMLDDLPELYEDALTWELEDVPTYSIAALVWCFARPALRDIALVQWCGDRDRGDRALEAQLAWEEGTEYPEDLAMQMWGEGPQPQPARLEQALALVKVIAAYDTSGGSLATAAWISWALGRSTHAEHYAKLAIVNEPEHGLAEIVSSFVTAGHLPAWAFEKRDS